MSQVYENTFKDLTGKRFGSWVVLSRSENRGKALMWNCVCDCGNTSTVQGNSLKAGTSTKCRDCYNQSRPPRTHGLTKHPLYRVWKRMRGCTLSPTHHDYQYYGGRGITICEEWEHDFKCFYDWAITHGYLSGLSIERVDVNGNYCPENCTWIPLSEQNKNTRRSLKNR